MGGKNNDTQVELKAWERYRYLEAWVPGEGVSGWHGRGIMWVLKEAGERVYR